MNIDDLKKVKDFLYEIRRKWHDLGIELEVKAEELEVIEAQYSDLGVCLRKMLLVWLKNHLKPPTWEAIEVALESKAINELELAARAGRNLILLPCPMLLLYSASSALPCSPPAVHPLLALYCLQYILHSFYLCSLCSQIKSYKQLQLFLTAADEASSHYNTEHTDDASRMDSREVETAKIAMCLSAL